MLVSITVLHSFTLHMKLEVPYLKIERANTFMLIFASYAELKASQGACIEPYHFCPSRLGEAPKLKFDR
jgi:hypothetical protein